MHNKLGFHCAHLAVHDDSTQMLKILLKYFSFDINVRDYYQGWTPLQIALKHKKFNVVMFLMKLQKPVVYKENPDKTILIL